MSAYVVAQIRIDDPEEYKKYLAGFFPILERHGGEVLAGSSNETKVIEGTWSLPRTVIMKFPSVEHATNWHHDPDYQKLAEHRWRAAEANIVVVDGFD